MEPYKAWATAGEAYRFVFGNLRDCITLAALPMLVVTVLVSIGTAIRYFVGPDAVLPAGELPKIFALVPIAFFVIYFAIYIMFAVAWHRRYLVGTDPVSPLAMFQWRYRHWRFLLKGVLLFVALALLFSLIGQVAVAIVKGIAFGAHGPGRFGGDFGNLGNAMSLLLVITIVLQIAFGYLFSRFALAFPAAAVEDTGTGLRMSWTLTDGYSLKFFLALFLVVLPVYVFDAALSFAANSLFSPESSGGFAAAIVLSFISQVSYFVGVALVTTTASITYRRLKAFDDAGRAIERGEAPPA